MNRADAYQLLCEYVQDLGLRRHMLGVEAGMRAYAIKLGQKRRPGVLWDCYTISTTNAGPIRPIIRCKVPRFFGN